MPQGIACRLESAGGEKHSDRDDRKDEQNKQECPYFRVTNISGQATRAPGEEMERKVNARNHHKHDRDCCDGRTVEITHALVVG